MAEPSASPVPRLTGADLMEWQSDVGPVPQHIGVLLVLSDRDRPDPRALAGALAERLGGVPALGRRPVRAPFGGGGWYWADDDRDPGAHVGCRPVPCADRDGLLAETAAVLLRRLPPDRSPWTASVLVGPDGSAAGVVLVLHHVLADGLSGLAVLGAVADTPDGADGRPRPPARPVSAAPSRGRLVRDAWRRRLAALRALGRAPDLLRRLRDGTAELGHGSGRAPRSGLNRPTGPHRRMALVEVDEQRLRSAAHGLGASVNDVLLVGVGESLRAVEARAGRSIDPVVVSVPVAVRQPGARVGVGNAVGVMPVSVPTRGPLPDRVRQVAAIRRDRLAGDHGRSLPLVLLAFRVLHALRLVGWFENRQRLVNTFVSAIPALPGPLRIGGAEVGAVVPLVLGQGNTTVAFASVRYHGRFVVTVATDPDVGPDSTMVAAGLRATLDEITAVARP